MYFLTLTITFSNIHIIQSYSGQKRPPNLCCACIFRYSQEHNLYKTKRHKVTNVTTEFHS